MLNAETLKFLLDVGKSQADMIVRAPQEPPQVYYVRNATTGDLARHYAELPPQNVRAHTIGSLVAYLKDNLTTDCRIWYDSKSITGEISRSAYSGGPFLPYIGWCCDTIVMECVPSDQYVRLSQFQKSRPALSQAELIRDLRITFRDCLGSCGELVAILQRVRFNQSSTIETEISHGKSSLGKAITGEVTGLKILPEYITLNIPVFTNPSIRNVRYPVECALDPDAATGTFRVIPLPGQLEMASDYASNEIRSLIQDAINENFDDPTCCPVFFGSPKA